MIDDFILFTLKVMAFMAAVLLWGLLIVGLILGAGVALHAVGVFTCDTVYCS